MPVWLGETTITRATCGSMIRAISHALPVTSNATRSSAARLAANASSTSGRVAIRPADRTLPSSAIATTQKSRCTSSPIAPTRAPFADTDDTAEPMGKRHRRIRARSATSCSASEFVSEIGGFFTPSLSPWKDLGERSDGPEEEHVRTTGCQAQRSAHAGAERAGEVPDLAAAVDRGVDAAPGGRAVERGPDDDHAHPARRARGRAERVGAVAAGGSRGRERRAGCRACGRAGGDRQARGNGQGAGDRTRGAAGKNALGLVGPVPARVDADVKAALLGLIAEATSAGWSFGRSCRVLGLSERRARYWQTRQAAGALEDRRPGGRAVHALRPEEVSAILELASQWGEIDGSHRKLAHRGSYLARVWVSPATVLRVLLAHGRALPYRAPRARGEAKPWPEWVEYRPNQVWGYDFSDFPAAGTSALAILDLVSRKWIDTMLCPEATHVQVQALFTRALERE